MKKLIVLILTFVLIFIGRYSVYAQSYTEEEVSEHNITSDCWVIYDGDVYDLTNYLSAHDRYLDIREWCGTDITNAFETKDGIGRDHKTSSYYLLENYNIGNIGKEEIVEEEVVEVESNSSLVGNIETESKTDNVLPYNIVIPLLLTTVIYWVSYLLVKKNKLGKISIVKFNGFWNSLLILLFLIPSFGFGIFMILRYKFPSLYDITFDVMYWHVELSIVVGVIAISHFIQRFGIYTKQIK
ncbi:MAG: cytochrome b5-like heme/steroid binding domain-containing protein [Candidatus Dojkabacteria bacterium]|nr:cytochrome b5-like heme/steroid binding domain-containing protein [Candidatus Dojkabacteria bacterium]